MPMSELGDSRRTNLDSHDHADQESSSTHSSVRTDTQFTSSTTAATTPETVTVTAVSAKKSTIKGPLQPSSLAMSFNGSVNNSQRMVNSNPRGLPSYHSSLSFTKRGAGDENDSRNATVSALFGPSVGPCVGDFAASYCRVKGRLFAATHAIMFYSNLFGFERRLCLHLDDVEVIESYRSTSVRIVMVDCEDYIFKGLLPHRDAVFDLLRRLVQRYKASEGGTKPMNVTAIQEPWGEEPSREEEGPTLRQRQFQYQGSNSSLMMASATTWVSEGGFCSEDRQAIVNSGMMGEGRFRSQGDSDDEDHSNAHDSITLRPRVSSDHTPEPSHRRQRNNGRHPGDHFINEENFLIPRTSDVTPPDHRPVRQRSHTEPTFRKKFKAFSSFSSSFYGDESSSYSATKLVQSFPSEAAPMTEEVSRAVSEPVRTPHSHTKESISSLLNGPYTAADGSTQDDFGVEPSREVRTRLFVSDDSRSTVKAATSAARTVGPSPPPLTPPSSPPSLLRTQTSSIIVDHEKLKHAWKDAKKPHDQVALEFTVLENCSLDGFVQLFFADDAPNSLAKYQTEHIGDKDVDFGPWKDTKHLGPTSIAPTTSWERSINYLHPLNNTVGPSQAKTTRQQCMQRYGSYGIILDNTTLVEGIPMADCFKVIDHWIVESNTERGWDGDGAVAEPRPSLTLSVTFEVVFMKRTMFKSLIQKNVKSETNKWFRGYAEMLLRALQENPPTNKEESPEVDNQVLHRDDVIVAQDDHKEGESIQDLESTHPPALVLPGPSHTGVSIPLDPIKLLTTNFFEGSTSMALSLDSTMKLAVCALLIFLAFQVASMKQSLSNMERQLETMQVHTAALLEVIQRLSNEVRQDSTMPNGCIEDGAL